MAAIRNSCVARGEIAPVATPVVYTVPAGFVLLLKNVSVSFSTDTGAVWYLQISAANSSANPFLVYGKTQTNKADSWTGWLALNAGDKILVGISGATIDYWVSGALLPYAP